MLLWFSIRFTFKIRYFVNRWSEYMQTIHWKRFIAPERITYSNFSRSLTAVKSVNIRLNRFEVYEFSIASAFWSAIIITIIKSKQWQTQWKCRSFSNSKLSWKLFTVLHSKNSTEWMQFILAKLNAAHVQKGKRKTSATLLKTQNNEWTNECMMHVVMVTAYWKKYR